MLLLYELYFLISWLVVRWIIQHPTLPGNQIQCVLLNCQTFNAFSSVLVMYPTLVNSVSMILSYNGLSFLAKSVNIDIKLYRAL